MTNGSIPRSVRKVKSVWHVGYQSTVTFCKVQEKTRESLRVIDRTSCTAVNQCYEAYSLARCPSLVYFSGNIDSLEWTRFDKDDFLTFSYAYRCLDQGFSIDSSNLNRNMWQDENVVNSFVTL